MHPISGRFLPVPRADCAAPIHHAAEQTNALHQLLKNAPDVFARANKAMAQIVAYCGDLPAAKSALNKETPQGMHGAINGMFNGIKKELLAYADAASSHRRNDGSREQWLLANGIGLSKECIADACLNYGNGLREIARMEPQPLDQKARVLMQAIAIYEEGLAQIEVALPHQMALSVQKWASKSKNEVKEKIQFNRAAIAKSMNSAGFDLRLLSLDASDALPPQDWVERNEFISRAAAYMEGIVVRQQQSPYLEDVHREMCRDDLALLVTDHAHAAELFRRAVRWQRDTHFAGRQIDAPTMNRTVELAQRHAISTKDWASVQLEMLKEQSLQRATGAQRTAATKQRNDVIAVRSNASEIIIEVAAITSWMRRTQVTAYMNDRGYGNDNEFAESLRDWLSAFDERSAAIEGGLLTQLTPMLRKQRVDGHHDLSCHALLHSAVRNLRVLEQEAVAMAASGEKHGVEQAVTACQELAMQKDQICESLADDLQRLQDYADLLAEPAAPAKLSKRQRQAAAKRARSDNPEGATAAPAPAMAAPVLFDTVMEGTLAGREKDGLMLVDNDLTGQVVSYRHGEDGLWQRVAVDAVDANTRAPRRAAAGLAPAARLTGAAKVTGKAQQYREKIQGYLKKMDGEKSFALAQYYHGRATVAQSAALDYLDRLRSDLLEAKTDPDALAAAGAERRRVAEAGRGMAQRLFAWVASQPQHDNGSLAYLLQHAPNVRVKQTLQRKMLDQAKLTRHSLTADFMDEYTIDSGYGHPTSAARLHAVHVHYGTSQAELDKFTACHLKYGDDNAPVRNKMSLELLKKIAGKSAPDIQPESAPATRPEPARRAYIKRRTAVG